jgi:hypothetical protein
VSPPLHRCPLQLHLFPGGSIRGERSGAHPPNSHLSELTLPSLTHRRSIGNDSDGRSRRSMSEKAIEMCVNPTRDDDVITSRTPCVHRVHTPRTTPHPRSSRCRGVGGSRGWVGVKWGVKRGENAPGIPGRGGSRGGGKSSKQCIFRCFSRQTLARPRARGCPGGGRPPIPPTPPSGPPHPIPVGFPG